MKHLVTYLLGVLSGVVLVMITDAVRMDCYEPVQSKLVTIPDTYASEKPVHDVKHCWR